MSEATTETETEAPTTEPTTPASSKNPHLEIAIRDRDAAKKRARELEARNRELEAKEAERESAASKAAEELERKNNDHAALTAREQAKREAAEKRAADAEAKLQARDRADREGALVDAVMPKLGLGNRMVVRGLIRELKIDAPELESLDEKTATDVAKKVREVLGDLYQPQDGGSPGTPGVNLSTKPPGEKPNADPVQARIEALRKARAKK